MRIMDAKKARNIVLVAIIAGIMIAVMTLLFTLYLSRKITVTPRFIGAFTLSDSSVELFDVFQPESEIPDSDKAIEAALREKVTPLLSEDENIYNVLYTYEHELIKYEYEHKETKREFKDGPYLVQVVLDEKVQPGKVFVYYIEKFDHEIEWVHTDTGQYKPIYTKK